MKYLGPISNPKDLVNKEYVDNQSGGGEHVELTQAEYDALSQAEKENGTVYFITDGVPEYTVINDSVPIGAIQSYAGASCPYGWLMCDGAAVSRETYSELFTAIGTAYGSGDGSMTFNLPDLRGRVVVGTSSSYSRGATGGEATHTLTDNEMPSHKHSFHGWVFNGASVSSGAHYGIPYQINTGSLYTFNSSSSESNQVPWGGDNTGGSQAHNNMQPYLVGNYIIKALNTVSSSALEELDPQHILFDMFYPVGSYYETSDATFNPNMQWRGTWVLETAGQVHVSAGTGYAVGDTGGEVTHKLTVSEMPSHRHKVSQDYDSTNWESISGGFLRFHTPAASGGTGTALNTYASLMWKEGGSQAHNNMQPYIVVNRWHRTA